MNFNNPLALWFFAAAAPIILLYLLKIRRKDYEISSTLLWRKALKDRQANAPWQKLQRNLLLLLQLIILSALVFAIARLAFPVESIASGSVVVLIDGTASMQATDVSPTRFDAAIRIADDLIRRTGTETQAAAILVSRQPAILFAGLSDKAQAARLLQGAAPGKGEADWQAAFSLASGLGLQGDAEDTTFVILSDGGFPENGLPPLPGAIEFIQVGTGDDNLAVSAMAARLLPDGSSAELFVEVTNYGETVRSARLTILRGAEIVFREEVSLDPGVREPLVFAGLSPEPMRYQAELTNIQENLPLDSLPIDDRAYTILAPRAVRDVLLVSAGNTFLERLLLLFPNIQASKTVPDENGEINLPNADFDLYIFDGRIPGGDLPETHLLLIDPPANNLFNVTGEINDLGPGRPTDHPLARFLDWDQVNVYTARAIDLPAWADPLIETDEGPLVFVGVTGERRVAVVAFDLHRSDLPLRVAFPILFANLLDFLAPHGLIGNPNGTGPGDPVEIQPPPGAASISVTLPDGAVIELLSGDGPILFTGTGEPGFYTASPPVDSGSDPADFTVNLFSQVESSIRPNANLRIGQATITPVETGAVASREVWGWLIGLALGFLMVEWVVYQRKLG